MDITSSPPSPGTVLIVGVGRFGRNYVTALAHLARNQTPLPYPIKRVIITRRSARSASDLVQQLQSRIDPLGFELIGQQIQNENQLAQVLKQQRPCLTCITARDPIIGDAIHALYTATAALHGPVLCEKPYSTAQGNGRSLSMLEGLLARRDLIVGMELPMAVVRHAMEAHLGLKTLFSEAREIVFDWCKQSPGPIDLITELFLHPWSLIPSEYSLTLKAVHNGKRQATVRAFLKRSKHPLSKPIPCLFRFQTGSQQRTLRIDQRQFAFDYRNNQLYVSILDLAVGNHRQGIPTPPETSSIAVANPLAQHLLAMLQKRPIVNLNQIHNAQMILEQLFGYQLAGGP